MAKKYSKYTSTLVFARQNKRVFSLAILIFLAIFLINISHSQYILKIRGGMMAVLTPIISLVQSPVMVIASTQHKLSDYWQVYDENAKLKQENLALSEYRQKYLDLMALQKPLAEIANFIPSKDKNFISARIIGDSGLISRSSWLIQGGKNQAIQPNSVALSPNGLVGVIYRVSDDYAHILRINDRNSYIPITIHDKNIRAILHGTGTPLAEILYIDGADLPQIGDEILTSGQGGIYPPHMPIGIVKAIDNQKIQVAITAEQNPPLIVKIINYANNK